MALGALAGGGLGLKLGKTPKHAIEGALIGAIVGAAANKRN